jgi:hypothetical protein
LISSRIDKKGRYRRFKIKGSPTFAKASVFKKGDIRDIWTFGIGFVIFWPRLAKLAQMPLRTVSYYYSWYRTVRDFLKNSKENTDDLINSKDKLIQYG